MFLGHTNPKLCVSVNAMVVHICKITEPRKGNKKLKFCIIKLDKSGYQMTKRAFFCCYLFFYYFIKSMRGSLIKHGRKLHRHLSHDPIIVDLQLIHICVNCVGLTLLVW